MSEPRCPICKSSNVQKSTAVVASGTTYIHASQTGLGVSSGGMGVGVGKSKGTAVSQAAKNNAAPNDPVAGAVGAGCIITGLLLIFAGAGLGVVVVGGLVGSIVLGVVAHSLYKDSHKKAVSAYEKQWYCHSCGKNFSR